MALQNRRHEILSWLSRRQHSTDASNCLTTLLNEALQDELTDSNDKQEPEVPDYSYLLSSVASISREDIENISTTSSRLPHWQLQGCTYFVTICLLNRSLAHFKRRDIAEIAMDAILFRHGKEYFLNAFVIMPDHIHLLIDLIDDRSIQRGLAGLKRFISCRANKILGVRGKFFQPEHFDHLVRHVGYWKKFFDYIHNNPVKAGLVEDPLDYEYSSLGVLYGDLSASARQTHKENAGLLG